MHAETEKKPDRFSGYTIQLPKLTNILIFLGAFFKNFDAYNSLLLYVCCLFVHPF